MANTDVTHLPAEIFSTPAWTLEVDQTKQFTGLGADGRADPTVADDAPGAGQSTILAGFNNPTIINGQEIAPLVIRDNPDTVGPDTNYLHYTGDRPVVLGGTAGNDILIAGDPTTTRSTAMPATTGSTAASATITSSAATATTSSPAAAAPT